MVDNFGRKINYFRIGVTDKCNLRCFYCMPEHGLNWLNREELLNYEELVLLSRIFITLGIEKIRITGGEPFVRQDMMSFLKELSGIKEIKELTLTTNGVLTATHVPAIKAMGIKLVNLSLDTLDRNRFIAITKRDELSAVMNTMDVLIDHGIEVKINAVVMENQNIEDIIPLVLLGKDKPVSVRFIEEMPFNGGGLHYAKLHWDHVNILEYIKSSFPKLQKVEDPMYSTAYNYKIPGHKGSIGIIAAYTRSFCGTCNRVRLTPNGTMKTCLYDDGVLNLRDLIRNGSTEDEIRRAIGGAINQRHENGWQAEKMRLNNEPVHESMATIGG